MKRFIFKAASVFMAIIVLLAQTQSLSAKTFELGIPGIDESAFELNEEALFAAMFELNKLDIYLSQNEGTTYSDLALAGSDLISNVSDISAPLGVNGEKDDLLGIPAFLWGCVLGWLGLLLVYILTDNDNAEVKKALKGCVIGTVAGLAVFYVFYFALSTTGPDNLSYY